jgi:hypothetical protein
VLWTWFLNKSFIVIPFFVFSKIWQFILLKKPNSFYNCSAKRAWIKFSFWEMKRTYSNLSINSMLIADACEICMLIVLSTNKTHKQIGSHACFAQRTLHYSKIHFFETTPHSQSQKKRKEKKPKNKHLTPKYLIAL